MDVAKLPWKKIDVVIALALCLLWIALSNIFSRINNTSPETGLLATVIFNILIVAVALFIYKIVRKGSLREFGFRFFTERDLDLGCGLFLLAYIFNFVYGIFISYFAPDLPSQGFEFLELLNKISYPWVLIFIGSFVIPVTEEIFFRGFLFSSLHKFLEFKYAAIISSLIFASLHAFVSALLPIFVLSLVLTYTFKKSGSLWLNIVLHMLLNTSSFLLLWFLNSRIGV